MNASSDTAAIECRDLACGYRGEAVIENVNLVVEPGEVVALAGPSGAGKSTLLRTILGMQPPLAGTVRVLGGDPGAGLGRRVGVLFQADALLSSETVLENIALPLRELTALPEALIRDIAMHKLALVELEGLEHRLPGEISGGQARRVALARAVALDPELILCDEPTAGLDPLMAAAVLEILAGLRDNAGATVVVVTHDIAGIRASTDRVAMIDRGGIRASGSYEDLAHSSDSQVREFFTALRRRRRRRRKEAA